LLSFSALKILNIGVPPERTSRLEEASELELLVFLIALVGDGDLDASEFVATGGLDGVAGELGA
jgi:hypothetical protein